jgi:hypothetical protein
MSPSLDLYEKKPGKGSSTSTEEHVISRPTSALVDGHIDEEKQEEEVHEDDGPQLDPLSAAVTTDSVIPPPPDGGLHAWLKVFGGFFIYVNIWSDCLTSSTSSKDTNARQGLHTVLRRIPSLLSLDFASQRNTLRYIMDWHSPSLASHLLWRHVRPTF